MSSPLSFMSSLIKTSWNYADLKTRIITPVMLILGLMTVVAGYSYYQSERSQLHAELNVRGQAITASLSAFATSAITADRKAELENHIKAFIEDKKLLHTVTIYQDQSAYLTVTSGMLRQKILPDTLKHYKLPVFSPDGKNEIGVIEVSLSTQEIDDHLAIRAMQITVASVAVVIVSIIILSWLLGYVVIRPLERLTNKIQNLSMDHINEKFISMSWDEIGHLFRDVNALRIRFKRKESAFIETLMNRKKFRTGTIPVANCKALVVDDDETIRMIAQKLLEKNNMNVTTAGNGKQALEILNKQKFDIILLDLMMPEMTGFEVINQLRENASFNNAPIIVVSSITDKESIVAALNNGATDFVIKPFNHEELMARVNIHISKYLSEKEIDSLIEKESGSLQN